MPDPYGPGDVSIFLRRPHRDLPAGSWVTLPSGPADPFGTTIGAFVDAVVQGRPAPLGAPDAHRALSVVHQLYADAPAPVTTRRS
jgi:hypothetical protein